jgi:hypothetical protein
MFVGHIENIIELPVCNTIDARCDEWIKLHVTFRLFRLREPVFPAGNEQGREDGRLYDRLAICCLNANISEVTYFQGFDKIHTVDVMPALSQFFL